MGTAGTLAELVADVATTNPHQPAIIFGDQPISYAQLNAVIERAADGLAACGVRPGDRVALMVPNCPEFAIAYYAILRLGAIAVPVNVLYKAAEIAYVLGDSEACALVVCAGVYEQAAPALHQAPSVKHVIVVGPAPAPPGTTPWPTLIAGTAPARPPVAVRPDDLAVVCYTSGTTGRAKGAMLTHRNLIANCAQVDASERLKGIVPADVILLVLPLFHIYALNVGLTMALRAGATIVLVARSEPAAVLEAIQRHRCTIFLGAPPMYVAWVNMADLASYDLSSLRATFSGAAPLPAAVLERFAAATGVEIVEGYGLTETAPVVTSNAAGARCKPGTVGPVIPGVEVRLIDEDDRDVPRGAAGELICRGENVMAGYWRQPEATAEALRSGWFHTGDIATVDADGYYTIVDRKKDMINAGGFKVWPREVEEVLYAHPAVRDAAVVAMPDPYAGERPLAVIALKEGQSATAEELIAYCKSCLASFKAPARVEFQADLPKLPTGKVLRRALRDEIWQRRSAATT